MARYYVRREGVVEGPWDGIEIRRRLADGQLSADDEAIEATGQTSRQLKLSQDWQTIANIVAMPPAITVPLETGAKPSITSLSGAAAVRPLTDSPTGPTRIAPDNSSAQYKVVPFSAAVARSQSGSDLAAEVERIILSHTSSGWEYVGVHQLQTIVAGSSGCFGLGATPPTTTTSEFVVFRR